MTERELQALVRKSQRRVPFKRPLPSWEWATWVAQVAGIELMFPEGTTSRWYIQGRVTEQRLATALKDRCLIWQGQFNEPTMMRRLMP